MNPLVGGSDGQGWPFEVDLNAAVLHQLLGAVDGVDRVEEVVLFEYDLRNGTRTGRGLDVIRLGRRLTVPVRRASGGDPVNGLVRERP